MFYQYLSMDVDENIKLINVSIPDPAQKACLGQKGYLAQPPLKTGQAGAESQEGCGHTSANHRPVIQKQHKALSDGCSPVPINALLLLTES